MFKEEADKAETKMIVESNGVYSKFKNYKDGFEDGAEFGYKKAKDDADKMKSQFLELCNLKDMRIKELEKANKKEHDDYVKIQAFEEENAELEKQHKIEKEKWYAEYTAMYNDFQKHIEELEKENGTLKERCDILDESLITSTKNNIERQKIIDEHNDQLTKAKELLSRLKSDFKNFAFEVGITLVSETYFEVEKFLKEINK